MELSILVHCVFQAYDHHLNMILGDCEETVTTIEIDEETYEEVTFFDFLYFLSKIVHEIFLTLFLSAMSLPPHF